MPLFFSLPLLLLVLFPTDYILHAKTAEDEQEELRRYDANVHEAWEQMAAAMRAELRALQVPFFAIRGTRALAQDELAKMQRRMLALLQDLCSDGSP